MYDTFIKNLEENIHFSFSRYGDGEWALILKKDPVFSRLKIRWGNDIEETGNILRECILSKPEYYVGIQPLAVRMFGDEILNFLPEDIILCNSDIFHKSSMKDRIDIFFNVLKNRNVVIIGPEYLKTFSYFSFTHIVSQDTHVWRFIPKLKSSIIQSIKDLENPVLLYSSSLATKIIIHELYPLFKNITQIDTGSLLDPYVGVNSRKYHSEIIDRINGK